MLGYYLYFSTIQTILHNCVILFLPWNKAMQRFWQPKNCVQIIFLLNLNSSTSATPDIFSFSLTFCMLNNFRPSSKDSKTAQIHPHGSYKWIIMLEKCGPPDLNVFHLKWIIGTHGNWMSQNPGGRFGATS